MRIRADGLGMRLRHIVRRMASQRRHSLGVALILGIGIGPAAVGLTVVDRVLLRPLPYVEPDRIGVVRISVRELVNHAGLAQDELLDLRSTSGTFKSVEGIIFGTGSLEGGNEPVSVSLAGVSPGLFDLFGVSPILGRGFRAEDFETGEEAPARVVVLSHHLWRTAFGGDPSVVGRVVAFEGTRQEIIGVLPPDFTVRLGPGSYAPPVVDMWGPTRATRSSRRFGFLWGWNTLVRLEDGVTFEQANRFLESFARQEKGTYPAVYGEGRLRFTVTPLLGDLVRETRPAIIASLVAVFLLLATATVNASVLVIAEHGRRRQETAVRAAIGASRHALLFEAGVESLLFSLAGMLAGGGLAVWGVEGVRAVVPRTVPRWETITFGWGAFLLPALLASSVLVVAALAAAWRHLTLSQSGGVRLGDDRTTTARAAGQSILVGCQIALALVLVFGATQLARSAVALARTDLGFEPRNAFAFQVDLYDGPTFSFKSENARYCEIRDRLASLPGVVATGAISSPPLSGRGTINRFVPDGTRAGAGTSEQMANFYAVLPGYFASVRTPIIRGRDFTDAENAGGLPVAIIDETLARQAFPGQDPIGRTLGVAVAGGSRYPRLPDPRIVGVVAHARVVEPTQTLRPQIYLPYGLWRWAPLSFVVRTAGDPRAVMPAAREVVRQLGLPGRAAPRIRLLSDSLAAATSVLRATTALVVALAVFAAWLAAFGLYAVVSYLVVQQRRATAIRIVVGASPGRLLRGQLARVGVVLACAVPAGMAVCAAGARLLESLVYGVAVIDAGSLALAAAVAVVGGLLATYVPARRAATADPLLSIKVN